LYPNREVVSGQLPVVSCNVESDEPDAPHEPSANPESADVRRDVMRTYEPDAPHEASANLENVTNEPDLILVTTDKPPRTTPKSERHGGYGCNQ
jgi:hypothetical protein